MGTYQVPLGDNLAVRYLCQPPKRYDRFNPLQSLSIFANRLLGPDEHILSLREFLELDKQISLGKALLDCSYAPITGTRNTLLLRARLSDYAFYRADPNQKFGDSITWAEEVGGKHIEFHFIVPPQLRGESGVGIIPMDKLVLTREHDSQVRILESSGVSDVHLFNVSDSQKGGHLLVPRSSDHYPFVVAMKPENRFKNGATGWHGNFVLGMTNLGTMVFASHSCLFDVAPIAIVGPARQDLSVDAVLFQVTELLRSVVAALKAKSGAFIEPDIETKDRGFIDWSVFAKHPGEVVWEKKPTVVGYHLTADGEFLKQVGQDISQTSWNLGYRPWEETTTVPFSDRPVGSKKPSQTLAEIAASQPLQSLAPSSISRLRETISLLESVGF
jgi:hypothetical protein